MLLGRVRRKYKQTLYRDGVDNYIVKLWLKFKSLWQIWIKLILSKKKILFR